MRILHIRFLTFSAVGFLTFFGLESWVNIGTSPTIFDLFTHFMTAVW
jgi:hypothetical protein